MAGVGLCSKVPLHPNSHFLGYSSVLRRNRYRTPTEIKFQTQRLLINLTEEPIREEEPPEGC